MVQLRPQYAAQLCCCQASWVSSRACVFAVFAGQFDYQKDTFLSASDDAYVEARIAFGIQGIDRSDYVIWEPDENRGIALFSDNFDVSTTVAQDFLLQTCADLRNVQCDLLGCASGTVPTTLVLPGGVSCWIEEFRTWYTVRMLCVGRALVWRALTCSANRPRSAVAHLYSQPALRSSPNSRSSVRNPRIT